MERKIEDAIFGIVKVKGILEAIELIGGHSTLLYVLMDEVGILEGLIDSLEKEIRVEP